MEAAFLKKYTYFRGKVSLHGLVGGGNHHQNRTVADDKMNGVDQVI